jgi:glycosyltransferase involved in cell wall biosynthesis
MKTNGHPAASQRRMRILLVHNYYQQPGGEDQVIAAEQALLAARGHEASTFTLDNSVINSRNGLRVAGSSLWNGSVYHQLRSRLREVRPHVVHLHNTCPLISPAAYYAAKAEGVAVVQTLHNYRLFCCNAQFFRNGQVCERCTQATVPWPGVLHACYRGSHLASAAVAAMLTGHRALGTWTRKVDAYIALTSFSRNKFVELGLPGEKVFVKPNFVYPDLSCGDGAGGHGLFVGRLSAEKGIGTLLAALRRLDGRVPFIIVGDGPLRSDVAAAAEQIPGLTWYGQRPSAEVYEMMGKSAFMVLPSEWYENFPRVIVESLAKGTPIIASKLGAVAELVDHERTGWHFNPGDAGDLADTMLQAVTHPRTLSRMREQAREVYEARYTAERNHRELMLIYQSARAQAAAVGYGAPGFAGQWTTRRIEQ